MKWLIGILIAVLLVAAIGGYIMRDAIGVMMFRAALKPPAAFAETVAPAPPDYATLDHWAALPDRADAADYVPAGEVDGQAGAEVDVFFVHPTTFIEKSGWNAPMGHADADAFVRDFALRGQASAYNGSARVFAPHYRQAQLYAFLALEDGGWDALELAYRDVEAAFEHYLAAHNDGRAFILAGHSQGAQHVRWLLERKVSGTPLAERLVAAYPVGYFFDQGELADTLADIPVCKSARETGCLATWNATGDGYRAYRPIETMVCVNPLSWTTGTETAGFSANTGALSLTAGILEAGVADARCTGGRLHVSEIRSNAFDDLPFDMGPGNYHLLDYALYWKNLRDNVAARVAAYQGG